MANNTELITGHGEDAHISSFDMRAFNRAVFGAGKYRFTDAENMEFTVDTAGKMFLIKSGSCMWSGMHIRVEDEEAVAFVSPATTSNVYLWLHYTRNSSSLVENVEFTTTTTNKVSSSLIYNDLPDDVTEAYTLFATIEYDNVNKVVKNTTKEFELVKGMSDFYKETTERLTAQAAENASDIASFKNAVNDSIANFKDEIVSTAHNMELLYDANINATGKRDYDLYFSLHLYRYIVFHIGDYQYIWRRPATYYRNGEIVVPLDPVLYDSSITIRKLTFSYYDKSIGASYEATRVYRDSLGTFFEKSTSFNETVKIYGIGKGT